VKQPGLTSRPILRDLEALRSAETVLRRALRGAMAALAAYEKRPTNRRFMAMLTRTERLLAADTARGEVQDRMLAQIRSELAEQRTSMGWRRRSKAVQRTRRARSLMSIDTRIEKAVGAMVAAEKARRQEPTERNAEASITRMEQTAALLVLRRRANARSHAKVASALAWVRARARRRESAQPSCG